MYKNCLSDRSCENKRNVKEMERALKYELRSVKLRQWMKLPKIWKRQLDGIIVKYCAVMLTNSEGVVNPGLFQLKIGTGPQSGIRKELKRNRQSILRMC